MKTISMQISELNNSAQKVFGPDISISLARAPAFGHDDFCYIVSGKRQLDVATDLLRFVKAGQIQQKTTDFMGHETTSTTIIGFAD